MRGLSLVTSEQRLLLVVVLGLLTVVATLLLRSTGSRPMSFSSCSMWVSSCSFWALEPGIMIYWHMSQLLRSR